MVQEGSARKARARHALRRPAYYVVQLHSAHTPRRTAYADIRCANTQRPQHQPLRLDVHRDHTCAATRAVGATRVRAGSAGREGVGQRERVVRLRLHSVRLDSMRRCDAIRNYGPGTLRRAPARARP